MLLQMSTTATVGSRLVFIAFQDANTDNQWQAWCPIAVPPSSALVLQGMIGGSASGVTNNAGTVAGMVPLPDILIPPGWSVNFEVSGPDPDDPSSIQTALSEIYTEDYNSGTLVPLTPSPLLT